MPWCSQLWAIWGKEVSCASAYAQAAPALEAPPGAGLPVALLLSGQACLRPSCYGGCLSPTRSQAVEGPSPGLVHCPLCQTYPEPAPGLGASTFWDQGLVTLWPFICPQHPRCPGTPPAELSLPHSPCLPTAHRTHSSQAGAPAPPPPPQQQADASGPARGTAHSGDPVLPCGFTLENSGLSSREV